MYPSAKTVLISTATEFPFYESTVWKRLYVLSLSVCVCVCVCLCFFPSLFGFFFLYNSVLYIFSSNMGGQHDGLIPFWQPAYSIVLTDLTCLWLCVANKLSPPPLSLSLGVTTCNHPVHVFGATVAVFWFRRRLQTSGLTYLLKAVAGGVVFRASDSQRVQLLAVFHCQVTTLASCSHTCASIGNRPEGD